jgi:hypothetical protein
MLTLEELRIEGMENNEEIEVIENLEKYKV